MTLQNINFTALSQANQQIIAEFQSPATESSVVKGVPLSMLSEVRNIVRSAANGRNVRVKFRGPRHDALALTCLKADAHSFAVYVD